MGRYDRENPNARNFGLQSRDMAKAGLNALKEGMQSYSSVATMSSRFNQFASYAKSELGIKDMRKLEREHVTQYASHLKERCQQGELSPATAQNYLSATNRVLEIARGDKALHVAPVREAGMTQRSYVATENKAISTHAHNTLMNQVSERLGAQMELQRSLGLRFEESCKIDATKALREAEKHDRVIISAGTKGGLDREVPITSQRQIEALRAASEVQGRDKSMIPLKTSYTQYKDACYKQHSHFHGERHAYAQERYEKLTGCQSPVAAGIEHGKAHIEHLAQSLQISQQEAKALDQQAREQIANELGHFRTGITNNYLG